MRHKEEAVYSLIVLWLLFTTAIICFTVYSVETERSYVPQEKEWYSPYPGKTDE